jgi:hypothetical protein
MTSETGKPKLYERLGGVYSIAAVVDDFMPPLRKQRSEGD